VVRLFLVSAAARWINGPRSTSTRASTPGREGGLVQEIRIATANRGAGTAPVFATVEGGYFGVTRAQLALAWLLERPHVGSVITGAVSVEQVESNLRAADLTLPADVRHAIEAIFPLEVAP
jgi:aryl-alcohol dehydrogenase-like predicted oxidoreductase